MTLSFAYSADKTVASFILPVDHVWSQLDALTDTCGVVFIEDTGKGDWNTRAGFECIILVASPRVACECVKPKLHIKSHHLVVDQCARIRLYVIDLKLVKQSSCNICAEDQDPASICLQINFGIICTSLCRVEL